MKYRIAPIAYALVEKEENKCFAMHCWLKACTVEHLKLGFNMCNVCIAANKNSTD